MQFALEIQINASLLKCTYAICVTMLQDLLDQIDRRLLKGKINEIYISTLSAIRF